MWDFITQHHNMRFRQKLFHSFMVPFLIHLLNFPRFLLDIYIFQKESCPSIAILSHNFRSNIQCLSLPYALLTILRLRWNCIGLLCTSPRRFMNREVLGGDPVPCLSDITLQLVTVEIVTIYSCKILELTQYFGCLIIYSRLILTTSSDMLQQSTLGVRLFIVRTVRRVVWTAVFLFTSV